MPMEYFRLNLSHELQTRGSGEESNFMLMMKVKFALERGELRYLSNTTPHATSTSQLIPTNQ